MHTENMVVSRLVVHEIFQRRDDKAIVNPRYGTHLISLNGAAMDAFQARVIAAVGNTSKSMEMDFLDVSDNSALKIAADAISMPDAEFVTFSNSLQTNSPALRYGVICPAAS